MAVAAAVAVGVAAEAALDPASAAVEEALARRCLPGLQCHPGQARRVSVAGAVLVPALAEAAHHPSAGPASVHRQSVIDLRIQAQAEAECSDRIFHPVDWVHPHAPRRHPSQVIVPAHCLAALAARDRTFRERVAVQVSAVDKAGPVCQTSVAIGRALSREASATTGLVAALETTAPVAESATTDPTFLVLATGRLPATLVISSV